MAEQMTLGKFIEALKALPADLLIAYDVGRSPGEPDSFRGYYEQLAFGYSYDTRRTVCDVLRLAENAMGETFKGYKGGYFVMHEDTPLWAASYGISSDGRRIVGVERSGPVVIVLTEEDSW